MIEIIFSMRCIGLDLKSKFQVVMNLHLYISTIAMCFKQFIEFLNIIKYNRGAFESDNLAAGGPQQSHSSHASNSSNSCKN